ncbi:MAG: class I SAM-dependent methyltransferase [Bacteroidota bacterium]
MRASWNSASVEQFPQPEEFVKILQEVGFAEVKWKLQTLGISVLYLARKPSVT